VSTPPGVPQRSTKLNFPEAELDWQTDAACTNLPLEVFYPERGVVSAVARRVCSSCEVRTACLEYALKHHEKYGIWGGLGETDRRALKRQRRSVSA